ncbi:MAG: hypothetical protein JWN50_440 [Parcubacteria group bacterium]|nr:hypothetical protein [Parcubacteria group bacterium]
MRVLIFSTSYYPMVGGAEVAVKEITDRIPDIQFDLICAKQKDLPDVEKIGNVTVYRIGFGMGMLDKLSVPFRGAVKAWQLNKKHEYDAFWAIMATYASGAGYITNILRRLSGKKKIPMILTLQEGDSEGHLKYRWGGLIDLSWRLALARTDTLTAISNYLLARARKLGFKSTSELIPNGVDMELFNSPISEAVLEEARKQSQKRPGDFYLITTSRLNVKNAISDVIDALKFLPSHIKFLILGVGELEEDLKRQAKRLGIEDRVIFLGFIEHRDLPKYLKISDIFIRPSLSEGMGNSFIEAMAAGLPVIATPVGGIPDFLFDPDANPDKLPTGLFVPVKSPKLIAFQIQKLMNDRVLHDKIVINARRMVQEKYDWNLIARDMKGRVFLSPLSSISDLA